MAKSRKDSKGRVLLRGECQRKSDGRYIYQFTTPDGSRQVIYATDLMELRKKEEQLRRDQQDGLDVYLSEKVTLNEVFDRYISTKYDLKLNTRSNYKYMYDHFVREGFGTRKIAKIKYSDVKTFYLNLIHNAGLKTNTMDSIHTVLHPTFTMAVRDGIIRNNPSSGVMAEIKKSSGKNKGVRHALTLAQQRAFLDYTANSPIYAHWLPLFTVLFGTGCRIGELIGLRWKDVDFENEFISINHSVIYMTMEDRKSGFHVSTPKTEAGERSIPMISSVKEAFLNERKAQEETGFNIQVLDGMSGFVFRNKEGMLLNPSVINRAIRRIYEAYNAEEILTAKREGREPLVIPHFTCHHIRHTFCTRLCESGVNHKTMQTIMGHANIETTLDIYAEVTKLKLQEDIRRIEVDIF